MPHVNQRRKLTKRQIAERKANRARRRERGPIDPPRSYNTDAFREIMRGAVGSSPIRSRGERNLFPDSRIVRITAAQASKVGAHPYTSERLPIPAHADGLSERAARLIRREIVRLGAKVDRAAVYGIVTERLLAASHRERGRLLGRLQLVVKVATDIAMERARKAEEKLGGEKAAV